MRITAIEPQKHHDERVNVYVDGEFRCGLAVEIVRRAGLRVGDETDEAALEGLERQDLVWKAREAAYSLLAYRARTRVELQRRLRRKGFPDDVIETCVASLIDKGYVDDEAFAESFVRDRVRLRPRGPRRLVQELRAKGVDPAVAEPVVEEVFEAEDVSEVELARAAATKWARSHLGTEAPQGAARRKSRERLYRYLARRGFAGDAVRTAMNEVFDDADGGRG